MKSGRLVTTFLVAVARLGWSAEWVLQESGTQRTLSAVHFVDLQTGYAAGFLAVLKTLDGGITWESLALPANATFVSIFAKSPKDVFVGRQGLYRSLDGGASWREIDQFPEAPAGSIFDIKFTSDTTGFLVKRGRIFRTLDGGDTWDPVFPGDGLFLSELETVGGQAIYATGGITYDGLSRADFVRSYDGGATWEALLQPTLSEILASVWVGPRDGYVFTFSQQVCRTSDGGDSWTTVNEALGELVLDASFSDAQTGFAVCYSGSILSTTNGGVSWTVTPVSAEPLAALARPCGGTCYAVGNGGRIFKRIAEAGGDHDLRITALNYNTATGEVELFVHSWPCNRYRIEVSLNLSAWMPVAEHTPEAEDWRFNVAAGSAPSSFYRVAEVLPKVEGN